MNFIDDVDLEGRPGGTNTRVGDQVTGVLDTVVAGAVDLDDVHVLAAKDRISHRHFLGLFIRDVQGLREDPSHRGLADPSGAAEEIGVRGSAAIDGPFERLRDRLLPDDLTEGLRPIASGEYLISGRGV